MQGYIAHQQQKKQSRSSPQLQLRQRGDSGGSLQRIQEEGNSTSSSSSSLRDSGGHTYSTTTQRLSGFRL